MVHYAWALTSKLQDAPCQVFSRSFGHDLPDLSGASKADQIKLLFVQFDSDIDTSLDALDIVGVHIPFDELFDAFTCILSDF